MWLPIYIYIILYVRELTVYVSVKVACVYIHYNIYKSNLYSLGTNYETSSMVHTNSNINITIYTNLLLKTMV